MQNDNKRTSTVSADNEEYRDMLVKHEMLELLSVAEEDVNNNRTASIRDTFDDIRRELKKEVKNRECNVDSSKKVLLLHAE